MSALVWDEGDGHPRVFWFDPITIVPKLDVVVHDNVSKGGLELVCCEEPVRF